ncbi:MAG: MAPEG family protein [Alphaproteobacteria bacterium]|nr:MAPEG family protein [Alphaproteobacteria bacterium]
MTAIPADLLSAIITLLAIGLYFYMGIVVGQMRHKHGIKAPATSGAPEFDCAMRVQMNTLEHLPVFLALLWLGTFYFHTWPWLPAALGLVWVAGRIAFMTGYMSAPEKRSTGFAISSAAEIVLFIAVVAGIVQSWPTV